MTTKAQTVNPELVLLALAHTAKQHGGFAPASPAAAVIWAVEEIERLRKVELNIVECTHEGELARLRTALESRTPDKDQWEHAAELLHRWVSDIRWCSATDSARQRSRTRVAQLAVELGLIDV